MGKDQVAFIDELIELIKYKMSMIKNADDGDAKSYLVGQVDGLMLVAMRLADPDQLTRLANMDLSLEHDINNLGD